MRRTIPLAAFASLCLIALSLVFYPATAPGQSGGGGGGGQGGGGGEETSTTNLSYPASFFGTSLLTGTIGTVNLGTTFPDGMSYACLIPQKIGTTTYPNTSCVTDNGDGTFTPQDLAQCQASCPNVPVERIYWQKNKNNVWLAGYGVPMLADQTTPAVLPAQFIDWGDNLEGKSWPVQTIRVEVNTFSPIATPADGAPNTQLRFDVWHVFGQGTNELWGLHTTDTDPPTPYTYATWPYAVNVSAKARLDISKLGPAAATCPATPTGASQSPYQGTSNLTWVVDNPTNGIGRWAGAAYTSQGVNVLTPELNIKGSYVYGYNWNLGSEPVPQDVKNTGWWRLTFYTTDKSIDFTNWLSPDVAGVDTLAPPTSDLQPSAGTTAASRLVTAAAEGGETGLLYVPQVDTTNQLTYIDICITGGVPPAATTTALTYSPTDLTFGSSTTLTAKVTSTASGTPTGTVSFLEGTNVLGTGALDSTGTATYTVTNLAAGPHSYVASYGGDANFAASTSSVVAVTVNPAQTSGSVTASSNPAYFGEELTLTAAITSSAGTPTGDVTFKDGSTTLGTGTLDSSGRATYTTSALSTGSHSITAAYAGSASFAATTSEALQLTINAATFGLEVSNPQASVLAGQSASYSFTVSPKGSFTGVVSFGCSGLPAHSECTFIPPTLTLGANAAQVTLTISTLGSATNAAIAPFNVPMNPKWLATAALALLASIALFLVSRRNEPKRQLRRYAWVGTLALALGFALAGCGGSTPRTPTGTYPVSITATSGSQTVTSPVTLIVQ